ncbi:MULTISPECIES: MFS transporter [unclassified Rhizobium]|uniref:MFS transporter n=1 Tax=unclassified Rhizobium TaxID=2613769 RepID=UPI001160B41A|nr:MULTISPECIES: MFS transporter [unclassified Rhizobium]TQX81289.1 MFS transporter [Rhizobium sp. rho-13.1]TQY04964.1 MFS transporter [Rhizobium sp. rho-1.1]
MSPLSPAPSSRNSAALNSPSRVLLASLIGTTIEFFDFYVYATAAVLVFPTLFFPTSDPTTGVLQSFATFSIAFFARPIGAIVFAHFGDRIGRKVTLVAALMTMGISTLLIGFLPSYASIGVAVPLLLAICRFGQGFGLGGEWGGAVLLATENAPEGKRSWYGMFPQLGAPVGLFLSSAVFWLLLHFISQKDFITWGWRVPFIASIILIGIGLWVRLSITETPELGEAGARKERVAVPVVEILLLVQIVASVFFGIFCPIAGKLSDRFGRRTVLVATTVAIGVFSFFLRTLLTGGLTEIYIFAAVSMALAGMTYGPIGTALAAPFPVAVRYTGASITSNFAGIFGASLAPFIATWLASNYGLAYVGYYMAIAAFITLVCIMLSGNEEI